MKKVVLIFAFIVSNIIFAQNDKNFVDALVTQKMAELEMQANPLYFYKMDYCEGAIQSFILPEGERCTSSSTYYAVYVFWKDGEIMKFQKFDNCGSFMPFPISFDRNMKKILTDKQTLKSEKLKPYNKTRVNDLEQNCFIDYKFVISGEKFEKSFKESDLDRNAKDKTSKYNNALHLIKIDSEISEQLKVFEKNGKFIREKKK